MPIVVKPASSSADKFATRAQNAAQDYAAAVANSQKDQAALAVAAQASWTAALSNPATVARWARKLQATGTAGWKAMVAAKGALRYGPGAVAAKAKWATNVQPFFDVLSGLSLPNRLPKGDPGNNARAAQVAAALHAKKVSG